LRGKQREYAALIGFYNACCCTNYCELLRAMRIRFFGIFAWDFINRARPIPSNMVISAIYTLFDAACLLIKARVFAFLLMRCCCAISAFRCFSAISRYIFVFVAFEILANPQCGIVGLIFENFSVL
jgi:hypothetical protein